MAEQPGGNGSVVYAAFIGEEYLREAERRRDIQAQGRHLITHSVAFITGMGIVLGLIAGGEPTRISDTAAITWLVISLICAALAMSAGIHLSGNRVYHIVHARTLDRMSTFEEWQVSENDALLKVATAKKRVIDANRKVLDLRTRVAVASQYAQIGMLVAGAIGIGLLIKALS
ncbi:hypothetical protein O1R50_09275 [Glycomyces luteolus]|uniref:Uncharacterized protein n=1 Tax=Glycomyces luteolus TaxID=2670330 RepID=A0A9X3PA93_9ACTN|nr:hypothetical protein [Glycomyces luteolus]MDA1359813.1 hypothetical protein [Glycomyces luteolus]